MLTNTNSNEERPLMLVFEGAGAVAPNKKSSCLEKVLLPGLYLAKEGIRHITTAFYQDLGSLAANAEYDIEFFSVDWLKMLFSFECTLEEITQDVEDSLRRNPDRPLVAATGHSYGGPVAERIAHEHPEFGIKSVVTAAGSHLGIKKVFSRAIKGYDKRLFGNNLERIIKLRSELGNDAPAVHHVATTIDHVVPPESAIPGVDNTRGTLLSTIPESVNGAEVLVLDKDELPGHFGVMHHPVTTAAMQEFLTAA